MDESTAAVGFFTPYLCKLEMQSDIVGRKRTGSFERNYRSINLSTLEQTHPKFLLNRPVGRHKPAENLKISDKADRIAEPSVTISQSLRHTCIFFIKL
jgi:hypothetical protein